MTPTAGGTAGRKTGQPDVRRATSGALDAASDAELVLAVARRDREAFVELFERYAGRIKAFMMRAGAAAADADEIAQDVMVAVWRRAGSFDPARAAASTWIYAIARNRRIDVIAPRRAGRARPARSAVPARAGAGRLCAG